MISGSLIQYPDPLCFYDDGFTECLKHAPKEATHIGAEVTCIKCTLEMYNRGYHLTEHQHNDIYIYMELSGITEPALQYIEIVGRVTV